MKVFFNASVVLAGLKSSKGGSAKLLRLSKNRKFFGVISEIILDEVLRNSPKIKVAGRKAMNICAVAFKKISPPPESVNVERCKKIVMDEGDAHILASCKEEKVDYLVTLDKKHLLALKERIKRVRIVTPGVLIELLQKSS